jgi:predicted dinucleotide-binding enzyme
VAVASRRPPEALALQARAIGPTVVAKSLRDALGADTIILAVPFDEHGEVAKALPSLDHNTLTALPPLTSSFGARSIAVDPQTHTVWIAG